AALNAGQVFGTRCAEHIASRREAAIAQASPSDLVEAGLGPILEALRDDSPITVGAIRTEVQARMSDHAGIVCNAHAVKEALSGARALNASIRRHGLAYEGAYGAARALQWRQM